MPGWKGRYRATEQLPCNSGSWEGHGCLVLGNRMTTGSPQCHGSVLMCSHDQPIPGPDFSQGTAWETHTPVCDCLYIGEERNTAFFSGKLRFLSLYCLQPPLPHATSLFSLCDPMLSFAYLCCPQAYISVANRTDFLL